MKHHKLLASIGIVGLLAILASGVVAQSAAAPLTDPDVPDDTTAVVASYITFQGRLTDPGTGSPLNGVYDLEFTFWSAALNGSQVGPTTLRTGETVESGLYTTQVQVDQSLISGQELWLRIRVRPNGSGTWEMLSPRLEVLPTMYALGLRPGAHMSGEATTWTDGWVLAVDMTGSYPVANAIKATTATGSAVYGNSTGGYGLRGYSEDGYAVYGIDAGSTTARGYGGYFSSNTGVGVYGSSSASSYYTNMYAPGIYGHSVNGAGVYGRSDSTSWPGYGGVFEGRSGVTARASGSSSQDGYGGSFISQNFRGIYAISQAGYYDAYFAGTGGIYAANYYAMNPSLCIVMNGGADTLEPGDVVAMAGVTKSPYGDGVILVVQKADETNATALVGVVVQAMQIEMREVDGSESLDVQPVEGSAPPKGYLAIVSSGLVRAVKVDVSVGSLKIGDLVTSASTPGTARKVTSAVESEGAILGKVAGAVDASTGTVPVFVTLR